MTFGPAEDSYLKNDQGFDLAAAAYIEFAIPSAAIISIHSAQRVHPPTVISHIQCSVLHRVDDPKRITL